MLQHQEVAFYFAYTGTTTNNTISSCNNRLDGLSVIAESIVRPPALGTGHSPRLCFNNIWP